MASAMETSPPPPPVDPLNVAMASLYVGDLHPEVTEKELEETFSTMGPLVSVRRFRSPFSNNSLSYAHINFSSPSDASKALASLNNVELKGVPMKIMRNQTHHLTTNAANLFVKNLDPSVTSGGLEGIFGKFGTILSCKVAEDNGKSKGFGYVLFASEDSAISALNALHGTLFEGKILYVSKFQNKGERKDYCIEPQFTNLYVKNLPEHFTEDSLREKFSECGKVFNVVIMKDGEGKSKGFGFVNFESHEDAKKAIETLNGSSIGSKKLYVGKAMKKAEREELLKRGRSGLNLYVKNLDVSIEDSKLEEMFSAFGKVSSVKVMRHNNGVSKGFGFVSFCSEEAGKKALNSLHGSLVKGKFLYVGVAQPKQERFRELQRRFSTTAGQSYNIYGCNWDMFQLNYNNNNYPVLLSPPPPPPPNSILQPNHLYPTRYHPVYACAPMKPPTQIPVRPLQQQGPTISGWVCQQQQQQHPMRYAHATTKQGKIWCKSVKMEGKRINRGAAAVAEVSNKGGRATTKISEILLEMEKSKIQKILDNPQYLAMQVMKAAQVKCAPNLCARQAQAVHYPPH